VHAHTHAHNDHHTSHSLSLTHTVEDEWNDSWFTLRNAPIVDTSIPERFLNDSSFVPGMYVCVCVRVCVCTRANVCVYIHHSLRALLTYSLSLTFTPTRTHIHTNTHTHTAIQYDYEMAAYIFAKNEATAEFILSEGEREHMSGFVCVKECCVWAHSYSLLRTS
jgi:hypothetical protein